MSNKPMRIAYVLLSLTAFLSITADCRPLKVICASRAKVPPVIDGVLDDACWDSAEVRTDITSIGEDKPLKRSTAMRFLYDDKNLYLGMEVFWDDMNILEKGIAEITKKHGPIQENKICSIKKYANTFGLEVFIDPGASGISYYQILFNAAGQIIGNFRCDWEHFTLKPYFKGRIQDKCWTVEFVCPIKGLKAGDECGLNICRNDETYYGIWKQVGANYHNPKMFGRLVIGDYRSWWDAAWGKGIVEELEHMKDISAYARHEPYLKSLHELVLERKDALDGVAQEHPPINRKNFEILYQAFSDFRSVFTRLESLYQTQTAMDRTGRGR